MKRLNEIKLSYKNGLITKAQYITQMHEVHQDLFGYSAYIKDTDIQKIEISDDLVIMTSRMDGIRMVCDKDDERIAPIEILNFNHYEENDFSMVLGLIKNGSSVFDIGANFGWYSLNVAKRFPDCKIYSFEPIPKTFGYLKANVDLNGFNNININNFGFADEEKEISFYYYPAGSGNASLANLSELSNQEEVRCSIKKLDDYMEKNAAAAIDFIKCDVEGAELLVFKGGLKSIEKYKPIIFTELLRKWAKKFNYHPNEVVELLQGMGYVCFVSSEGKLKKINAIDDLTVETNFFFLHADKHSDEIIKFT